jgi:hypothetical protein
VNCEDRSGFLFAHACDRPATGACSHCGKQICIEHTRFEGGTPLCVTCMATTTPDDPNADPAQAQARAQPAEDDPYFYRSRHYDDSSSFDTDDYSAFDESDSSEGAAEGDLGAS